MKNFEKLNKIKDIINNAHYYQGTLEDFLEEGDILEEEDEKFIQKYNFEFVENIGTDEHRWYIIGDNVYKILEGNKLIGHLCVSEIITLKSEESSIEDLYVDLEAFNVEPITKQTFKIID